MKSRIQILPSLNSSRRNQRFAELNDHPTNVETAMIAIESSQTSRFWNAATCFGCCVVAGLMTASSLHADEFHLRNGGLVEGRLLEEVEADGETVLVIQTDSGAKLTINKSQIRRTKESPPELAEYESMRDSSPDTIESHWQLAEYCREHRLRDEREFELWQIVRLDPDHEEARRGLGFSKLGNQWSTQDQYMSRQGYVRVRGKWRLANEVVIDERRDEVEANIIQWRKNLENWTDWLGKRRHPEAIANLQAIEDPNAVGPLAEMLAKASTRPEKLLLIETMAQIDSHSIVRPLSIHFLAEDDDDIRETCLRIIKDREEALGGETLTPRFFMGHLDPATNSPAVINRAGRALEVLASETAVRSLIEALITEHKATIGNTSSGGGQGINFGAGGPNGGLGSFSVGGDKPREVSQFSENPGVLAALHSLTDINYGFDKQRWLDWYIQENSNPNVDLRRSGN